MLHMSPPPTHRRMELIQQRDELLAALKDARELVDDWGAYAAALHAGKAWILLATLGDWTPPYQRWRNNHDNNSIRRPIPHPNGPVHHPYSTADILRRNVADYEIALKQQTERAEKAEAELAKLAKQKPVRWHVRGNYFHDGDAAILFASRNSCVARRLISSTPPSPAPAVSDADSVARFEAWVLAQADAQPHWRIGRGTLCNKYLTEATTHCGWTQRGKGGRPALCCNLPR